MQQCACSDGGFIGHFTLLHAVLKKRANTYLVTSLIMQGTSLKCNSVH